MARPRAFDEQEVIDRAMTVFWHKGYEATSMCDLLDATGLTRGSLYKAFKSKRGLFLRALEVYLKRARAELQSTLNACAPKDALESWIDGTVGTKQECKGCFIVNITVEMAPDDEEVRALLGTHDQLTEQLYAECIKQGQQEGIFCGGLDAAHTAQLISVMLYGLQARARAGLDPIQARRVIAHMMSSLCADPT